LKRRAKFALRLLAFMSLLTAATAQPAGEPSPLTLQRAVTIALEKNPLRKVALADTRVASADIREARSATEVGLGPTHFLKDQKLELKKGDTVEVIGATATTRQGKVFIARQITTGGKTVILRDEKGTPAWPSGMCRP
jgi:hypothetical protein